MGTIVSDWLEFLDQRFPPSWAEEWDNSGLQAAGIGEALVSEIPTDPFGRP